MKTKLGKKSVFIIGGVAAVAALTLSGALPAGAYTAVYHKGTSNFSILPLPVDGTWDGHYGDALVYDDYAYNQLDSHLTIRHYSKTSSATHYGNYAGAGSNSTDTLDYANVTSVGVYFYE